MEKERARSDMWEAAQGQHRTEVVRDWENKQQLDFYKLSV